MSETVIGIFLILILIHVMINSLQQKIIESKLNIIMNNLNVDFNKLASENVLKLIESGKKMAAVRTFHRETGLGLEESKRIINELSA